METLSTCSDLCVVFYVSWTHRCMHARTHACTHAHTHTFHTCVGDRAHYKPQKTQDREVACTLSTTFSLSRNFLSRVILAQLSSSRGVGTRSCIVMATLLWVSNLIMASQRARPGPGPTFCPPRM